MHCSVIPASILDRFPLVQTRYFLPIRIVELRRLGNTYRKYLNNFVKLCFERINGLNIRKATISSWLKWRVVPISSVSLSSFKLLICLVGSQRLPACLSEYGISISFLYQF